MGETKVDETKPCEPKPKKMVRRSVAVALGIVCILLIALIAYFTVTGISAQNSYNNLQNQNKQLQNQVNNLTGILNLIKSTVWVDNQTITEIPQDSTTNWTCKADYLGYISVQVYSGTTVPAAEVAYS